MATTGTERFDAQSVGRLLSVSEGKRFEMQFRDSEGRQVVVSLPARAAVELGCIICDVSEHAPYLIGGVRRGRGPRNAGG